MSNWKDSIRKAPQKSGSFGFRISDRKYGMINQKDEATWLLQELVEDGADVEQVINEFIKRTKLDDKEIKEIKNILQPYLQAHEKAHNQIVNMDWKVDTKKYPEDKYYERD